MRHTFAICLIVAGCLGKPAVAAEPGEVRRTTPDVVLGQADFTTSAPNFGATRPGEASASGLHHPNGIGIGLYGGHPCYVAVADTENSRVLIWKTLTSYVTMKLESGQRAAHVLGQPDFQSTAPNAGGRKTTRLDHPYDVFGMDGEFLVADTGNHRIIGIKTVFSESAQLEPNFRFTLLYGQVDSTSKKPIKAYAIDEETLFRPKSVIAQYISDFYNHRVLYIPVLRDPRSSSRTPRLILGQLDLLSSREWNRDGVSALSLAFPRGMGVGSGGNLFVADFDNHRVLVFRKGERTAHCVIGQGGDFSTRIGNKGGLSAKSLFFPADVAIDPNGNLYVADMGNHRVLKFNNPLKEDDVADMVFGQKGDFTTRDENKGGLGAGTLSYPSGVVCDKHGHLYISDTHNNRVLVFYADGQSQEGGNK